MILNIVVDCSDYQLPIYLPFVFVFEVVFAFVFAFVSLYRHFDKWKGKANGSAYYCG